MHNKSKLYVISHTHWDREWYQTFQAYRKRLVYMMDELLDHMEKDPDYKYFHMDGQTIVLEDYLQIRPENESRLKGLIQQGRILIGPWYVMPDEFLVSGESLVRNLQKGFEISREYGVEPLKNGYVVDIFGHNSQFPQILRGFGIDSALLYRGIAEYPKDVFVWKGADDSSVLALKMDRERSYSNFYFGIRWPFDGREYEKEELVSRMKELQNFARERAVSDHILMLDGVDHIEIEPELTKLITILNENIEDMELVHATLEDYIDAQKKSGVELDEIKGELYNLGKRGINNQVLRNVLSSMVHIKQMNDACETLLTRWAEPFAAAAGFVKPQTTQGFFEEAWKTLIQNHPHDSICGCSISRVHKDNEYRFDQVKDIAEEIIKIEFKDITSAINTKQIGKENAIILFNSSQKEYEGIVETELEFPAGSQGNFKLFDASGVEVPYQLISVRKNIIKGVFEFRRLPDFPQKDYYKVAFRANIPAVGYVVYGYEEYKSVWPSHGDYTFKKFYEPTRYLGSMQTGHRTWENEFLKLTIENNGTLTVDNKETGKVYKDLLIFEDCADVGDGWNYRKPAKDSRFLSINTRSDFSVEYDGRFSVQLKLTHSMNLPEKMSENGLERSQNAKEFKVITYITLKKGSRKLEFRTEIDNNILEHRLRVLFPNYLQTGLFYSSTPYYLQEREIEKKDWSSYFEVETGVFPNQGVIMLKDAGDCMAVYNRGLYEVEVTEDASHTVALTLFRSFRNEVGRNQGEMSFMVKSMSFDYALEFMKGDVSSGEVMVSGEGWRSGLRAAYTQAHEGTLGSTCSFLKLDIPDAVLSVYKPGKEGTRVVRLYNCTDKNTEGSITLYNEPEKVYLLNMNEEVIEEIAADGNSIHIKLGPAQIISIGVK